MENPRPPHKNTDVALPVVVRGLPAPAVELVNGEHHNCARLQGGAVHCWGHGAYRQLGDGLTDNQPIPVASKGVGEIFTPGASMESITEWLGATLDEREARQDAD